MKKQKCLAILLPGFMLISIAANAQESRRNVLKINPLSLFLVNASLFYERGFTPRSSAQVGVNFASINFFRLVTGTAYGITPEYRYCLTKKDTRTPGGFYVGPWLRYEHFSLSAPLDFKDSYGHVITSITTSFSA